MAFVPRRWRSTSRAYPRPFASWSARRNVSSARDAIDPPDEDVGVARPPVRGGARDAELVGEALDLEAFTAQEPAAGEPQQIGRRHFVHAYRHEHLRG